MPITAQRENNYRTYNIRESGMKKARNSELNFENTTKRKVETVEKRKREERRAKEKTERTQK